MTGVGCSQSLEESASVKTPRSTSAKPSTDRAALLPLLGEVFRAHGYEGASLALIT